MSYSSDASGSDRMPSSQSVAQVGKRLRLGRIISPASGRTIIAPIDDSLIFGPFSGLERVDEKLSLLLEEPPDAVLAFPGVFRNRTVFPASVARIVNVTASTTLSQHTRKTLTGNVRQVVQLAADAVAVHVNVSSAHEHEMLGILGALSHTCESYGMPLVAIMYPRRESGSGDDNYNALKLNDARAYANLVAHAARIGVDLGADLIKTQYTGDPETFSRVVEASHPIPVVVAGGPLMPVDALLRVAFDVIQAGGAGISFGRNVFGRPRPRSVLAALKAVVHNGVSATEASALLTTSTTDHDEE